MPILRALASASFLALTLALSAAPARADVGEAYGFGARTAALAGARVGSVRDAFAAYNNPAGIPLAPENGQRFSIGFGLIYMSPTFTPIQNIVVENTYVSDKLRSDDLANVDQPYRDTFGQLLSLNFKLLPQWHDLSLGVVTFLPLNALAYMDTGQTYLPEYMLYRARTQRPQFEMALGAALSPSLRLGAGLHLAYSLSSNASLFLQSDSGKPSTMRFSAALKPKLSPYLGLLFTPADHPDDFGLGLVLRAPATADNEANFKTTAHVIGTLPALDFNFGALSALFYDPASLEIGTSIRHGGRFRLAAQLDYQLWRLYAIPAMKINGCADASCGVVINNGPNLPFTFRNIIVPRVGEEIELGGGTVLRLGYAFRPSILADDVPTGAGNYLDPPKHQFNAGLGFRFRSFLGYDLASQLDLNASYQLLVSQAVAKIPGDETGAGSGDLKIGAPGYTAGGSVAGGGATFTLLF